MPFFFLFQVLCHSVRVGVPSFTVLALVLALVLPVVFMLVSVLVSASPLDPALVAPLLLAVVAAWDAA